MAYLKIYQRFEGVLNIALAFEEVTVLGFDAQRVSKQEPEEFSSSLAALFSIRPPKLG